MLKTKQNAGLSLAVTYTLTQSKSIHCEFLTFFISVHNSKPRPNIDAMLEIPTTCRGLADNEKHGRDVGVDVFLIGCADVPNQ